MRLNQCVIFALQLHVPEDCRSPLHCESAPTSSAARFELRLFLSWMTCVQHCSSAQRQKYVDFLRPVMAQQGRFDDLSNRFGKRCSSAFRCMIKCKETEQSHYDVPRKMQGFCLDGAGSLAATRGRPGQKMIFNLPTPGTCLEPAWSQRDSDSQTFEGQELWGL